MTDLTDSRKICGELEGRTLEDEWEDNPEPARNSLSGTIILDCNIDGQAWLWDTSNPDANLVYEGETAELSR